MPKKIPWSRTATVYQIYPRSFKDSNGDGVGDLPGIISELDYLQNLGVGAIWLSPIYKSPMADFGYDVADYCAIEPLFGTMEDFDRLVAQARNRSIKIIMDFVPNHTSDQHPWFLESRSSKSNPKRDWYIWADPFKLNFLQAAEAGAGDKAPGDPPNNWLSVFGGSGWEWDETTQQYYFHSFLKQQPDLNWNNPEVRSAMKDVLEFWLKRGVGGFRTDAAHWLIKDKLLRDNPVNPNFSVGSEDPYHRFLNIYTQGQPETLKIINEFCQLLGSHSDAFMVTELHGDIETMKKYFRACDNGSQSPFNFNLIGMQWSAKAYRDFVNEFEKSLELSDWPNYVLGNHDQSRVASRVGQDRARLLALLQFTLHGMPFVYYGEEIGMENVVVPLELTQDPFEISVPGMGLGRDPQRSPMQWSAQDYAGFSSAKPWLPLAENFTQINVENELQDSRSMLSLYRRLIQLRNKSEVLLCGTYKPIDVHNENVFAFERTLHNKTLVTLLNFSDQPESILLPGDHRIILSTRLDLEEGDRVLEKIELRACEGLLVIKY